MVARWETRWETTGHPRVAAASAGLAPVLLIGGWLLAQHAQPTGFDPTVGSLSALAARDTPHRWIMTVAFLLTGLCHLVTAYAVPRLPSAARLVLGLGGLGTVAVAAVPLPAHDAPSVAHVAVATVAFVALAAWPALSSSPGRPWPQQQAMGVSVSVLLGLGLLLVALAQWGPLADAGTWERLVAAAQSLWPAVVAGAAWSAAGRPVGTPRVRLLVTLVALTLAGALGGSAATVLAPATAQTANYAATVSLNLDPLASGTVRATTTFGDVQVAFRGLAPGIIARPEVKASITDVLSRPGVDLSSLQPSGAALDAAVRSAAMSLGWRFVAGAVLAALALAIVTRAWPTRRPGLRPWRATLGAAVGCALLAAVATGAAAQRTYRLGQQSEFVATGLLGVVQENQDLLGSVETRAGQVAPYLRNLLALSTALREKYAPTPLAQTPALRILLVSDIHASNQYALMRTIVESERIDAVIDSGDIVNFGRAEELAASGIPAGIRSLKVPYLFVGGNHDASSHGDQTVLAALAKIPNVVLLQPNPHSYTVVDLDGLRVAGFNDPRWFGDDNTGNAAKQKPAADRFTKAMDGQQALDIVVSHEPAAVRGLGLGSLLINGHMHSAAREGNRLQVGTFTGGGSVAHYLDNADGSELSEQPSAFDILGYDATCGLQSVTRYAFSNVLEGRPAYDNVTLLNGSQVVPAATRKGAEGEPERTCSTAIGVEATSVEVGPGPS